jgi:hypothetical protein
MADKPTINKQISVQKTGKALVELCDNIRFQETSAWPFDKGARILCRMKDYSNGTGENAIDATHNIAITDIKKVLTKIEQIEATNLLLSASGRKITENVTVFSEDKILDFDYYRNPKNPAERIVTQLQIIYSPAMNNPYNIQMCNGWGIPEKTTTGGTKIKSGSLRIEKKVKMFLTYDTVYALFKKADMVIDAMTQIGVEQYRDAVEKNS